MIKINVKDVYELNQRFRVYLFEESDLLFLNDSDNTTIENKEIYKAYIKLGAELIRSICSIYIYDNKNILTKQYYESLIGKFYHLVIKELYVKYSLYDFLTSEKQDDNSISFGEKGKEFVRKIFYLFYIRKGFLFAYGIIEELLNSLNTLPVEYFKPKDWIYKSIVEKFADSNEFCINYSTECITKKEYRSTLIAKKNNQFSLGSFFRVNEYYFSEDTLIAEGKGKTNGYAECSAAKNFLIKYSIANNKKRSFKDRSLSSEHHYNKITNAALDLFEANSACFTDLQIYEILSVKKEENESGESLKTYLIILGKYCYSFLITDIILEYYIDSIDSFSKIFEMLTDQDNIDLAVSDKILKFITNFSSLSQIPNIKSDVFFAIIGALMLNNVYYKDNRCLKSALNVTDYISQIILTNLASNKQSSDNKENTSNRSEIIFDDSSRTLIICKGTYKCNSLKHRISSATGILSDLHGQIKKINVNYCSDCNLYFINLNEYNYYRKLYGTLLGNFRIDKSIISNSYNGGTLSSESVLRFCGYTVNQTDDLTDKQRHLILANIMDRGILPKYVVIEYLNFFINNNRNRISFETAVQKWENDLAWVRDYKINSQRHFIIEKIEKNKS